MLMIIEFIRHCSICRLTKTYATVAALVAVVSSKSPLVNIRDTFSTVKTDTFGDGMVHVLPR